MPGVAVLSLYLLLVTVRAYRGIRLLPRLAGIAPRVFLITALVALLGFLRY